MNLRDCATHLAREEKLNMNKTLHKKTLLFVGSKGVGKTTLINRFLDKNDPAKKTLALEYTFARKTSTHSISKDVCHIWELGGGTTFTSAIQNGSSFTRYGNLSVVLMLDLSELDQLWLCLDTLLDSIKCFLNKLSNQGMSVSPQRIVCDHPDSSVIDPFPVPLIIIGGKYDLFQEFEPEKKKIVSRCLRYISHVLYSDLIYYSNKDGALLKRVKEVLNHEAFGSAELKTVCQDHNKAICVPRGLDLLENIKGFGSITKSTLDKVRHIYTTHFPQNASKISPAVIEDIVNDSNFREPLIDALRRQKDEDLELFCHEANRMEKRNIDQQIVT